MSTTVATKLPASAERAMVAALRSSLRGDVIDRGHPAYDQARRVWNGLIDRHPAVIARCSSSADVVEAVRVAREHRPVVSIRGGGHQVAGSAVCDDGLVIDLSTMKGVQVDPNARTVRAQAGVTWGELDRETQLFGLATPGGEVSETGVAGLTLGGGMGLLMRAHGLSCDNLRSLQLVTADGMVRTVSRSEHPELLWAARGGGRGLGVVTAFEFELHPIGPEVATALTLYPYQDAERLLRAWPEVTGRVSETVTPELALWSVPPDPAIPQELHGIKTVVVSGVHAGAPDDASAALAPLRQLGTPLANLSGTAPYLEVQRSVDEAFPHGGRYYMLSHFMDELPDQAIRAVLDGDARRPTPETLIVLRTLGGAVARVGAAESAYAHRSARFNLSIDAAWSDPALDDTAVGWARSTWGAVQPFSTDGIYLNFAGFGDETPSLHRSALGANQERLDHIRRTFDPDGLFHAAAHRP